MFNKMMMVYSAFGMLFCFGMLLAFVYLTRVSAIDLIHGIILIALSLIGAISGAISTLHYEDRINK